MSSLIINCGDLPWKPIGFNISEDKKKHEPQIDVAACRAMQASPGLLTGIQVHTYIVQNNIAVLGANVLDFFTNNPDKIPKGLVDNAFRVFFWGTLYITRVGDTFPHSVRYLSLEKGVSIGGMMEMTEAWLPEYRVAIYNH